MSLRFEPLPLQSLVKIIGPQWNTFNHVMSAPIARNQRGFQAFGMGDAWRYFLGEVHKVIWREVEDYWGRKVVVVGLQGIPYRWPEWMLEPYDNPSPSWEV